MAKTAIMAREDQSLGNRIMQFPSRVSSFLTDVRNEMRKVTFPSRKEVQATTLVVIITVTIFGIYFFLLDQLFAPAVQWVLKHH
jgi:preprotein translocase subunit SecE